MTVTEIATNNNFKTITSSKINEIDVKDFSLYKELIYASALCNNASLDPDNPEGIIGDPTEGALIFLAKKFNINHEELEDKYPRKFEQPFDSNRKRMSTIHIIDNNITAYTKGAVDEMLPLCDSILTENGIRPLTNKDKEDIKKQLGWSDKYYAIRYKHVVNFVDSESIDYIMGKDNFKLNKK